MEEISPFLRLREREYFGFSSRFALLFPVKLLLVLLCRKLLLNYLEYFLVQKLVNISPLVRSEGLHLASGFCDLKGETREKLLYGK